MPSRWAAPNRAHCSVDPLVKAGLTDLGRERLAVVRGAVLRLDATVRSELGPDGHRELRALMLRLLPAPAGPAASADPT